MADGAKYERPMLSVLGSVDEVTRGTLVSGGPDVVLFRLT